MFFHFYFFFFNDTATTEIYTLSLHDALPINSSPDPWPAETFRTDASARPVRGGGGIVLLFFFNDPATTEIYTLSLHDALPISFVPAVSGIGTGSVRYTYQTGFTK